MKILFLTSRLPFPPHRGDKLKIYNLIKQLSRRGHDISLISFIASKKEEESVEPLKEFCTDVDLILLRPVSSFFNCLLGLFSPIPFQILYLKSPLMRKSFSAKIAAVQYDLVHVHLIRMAQYADEMTEPKRILDLTDAGSLYLERFLKSTGNPFKKIFLLIELARLKRYERILEKFDTSLVCSDVDAAVLQTRAPHANIKLLYNGIDLEYFSSTERPVPSAGRIIYTGNMSYYPNIDGALFFIREVFPKIKKLFSGATLHVVGQSPPSSLKRLGTNDIVVTGFVSDIKSEYLQSMVAVAPIRFGAGTLNKILEPMALGLPVVATSVAKEGLPVEDGRDILVADSSEAFAESVVKILRDKDLRQKMGKNAQGIVRNLYDWKKISGHLEETYNETIRAHRDR